MQPTAFKAEFYQSNMSRKKLQVAKAPIFMTKVQQGIVDESMRMHYAFICISYIILAGKTRCRLSTWNISNEILSNNRWHDVQRHSAIEAPAVRIKIPMRWSSVHTKCVFCLMCPIEATSRTKFPRFWISRQNKGGTSLKYRKEQIKCLVIYSGVNQSVPDWDLKIQCAC